MIIFNSNKLSPGDTIVSGCKVYSHSEFHVIRQALDDLFESFIFFIDNHLVSSRPKNKKQKT